MPTVSIIVPAFNSEPYIAEALDSVLRQTWKDFEIIVVDDGSTDGTTDVVDRFVGQDSRVRLLRSPVNKGVSASRNMGLAQANGEWITLLDADDWYHPERLETLLSWAHQSGARLLADNQYFVMDGTSVPWRTLKRTAGAIRWISAEDFLREDSMRIGARYAMGYVKPFVQRAFLVSHNISYLQQLRMVEDFHLMMQCLSRGERLLFVQCPLYHYRFRRASTIRKDPRARDEAFAYVNALVETLFPSDDQAGVHAQLGRRKRSMDRVIRFRRMHQALRRGQLRAILSELASDPLIVVDIARGLPLIAGDNMCKKWAALRNKAKLRKAFAGASGRNSTSI